NAFKAIFTLLFITLCFVGAANAQFGDLMKKAQDKIDKSKKKVDEKTNQTNQSVSTGSTTNYNNEGARWDLFKCNPEYVGAVDENKLREIIEYNVAGDWGKGGLIVFTKQPLTKKNPTINDTVWTFKAGEPIYMNIVLPEARELDDAIALSTGGDVITTVGAYQKECQQGSFKNNIYVNYGRFDKSLPQVFALDFQPKGGVSAKYQQEIKNIAVALSQLKPGVHLVPIRISDNSGDIAAVGAFYYDNRDGSGNLEAIEAGKKAVTMPAANPKFAALERQIVGLTKGVYLRSVVTSSDWTPVRHEVTGVLIGRAIGVISALKLPDGTCRRETQTWVQDYDGRNYTNLHLDGFRDQMDMACENALK
ncbi:MAG: hypothetical protein ABWZ66_09375, partial [Pyrinomonadaceae bacterium]